MTEETNEDRLGALARLFLKLGVGVLASWPAWLIAVGAAVLVVRFRTNTVWLVLGGAVVGRLLWGWVG